MPANPHTFLSKKNSVPFGLYACIAFVTVPHYFDMTDIMRYLVFNMTIIVRDNDDAKIRFKAAVP